MIGLSRFEAVKATLEVEIVFTSEVRSNTGFVLTLARVRKSENCVCETET